MRAGLGPLCGCNYTEGEREGEGEGGIVADLQSTRLGSTLWLAAGC